MGKGIYLYVVYQLETSRPRDWGEIYEVDKGIWYSILTGDKWAEGWVKYMTWVE